MSFTRTDDAPDAVAHLSTMCESVDTIIIRRNRAQDMLHLVSAEASGTPFLILRDENARMRAYLDRAVRSREFDAVHADQLWMAQYAAALDLPAKVLDIHSAIHRTTEQLASHAKGPVRRTLLRREAHRLRSYEPSMAQRFDRLVFVTDADRRAVIGSGDGGLAGRSWVIPIGLDVAATEPVHAAPRPYGRGAAPQRVTFLGTMYWPPNEEGVRWFADRVLPIVRREVPDAIFTVVGRRPSKSVRELQSRTGGAVHVAGYVEDTAPVMLETAAFVVPLLSGGGMRVKILDAWAAGVPVVSTTTGAEGIALRDGRDGFIADAPEAFAEAVVRLLQSEDLRRRIGESGRARLETMHDCATLYEAFDDVYASLLGADSRAGPAEGQRQ